MSEARIGVRARRLLARLHEKGALASVENALGTARAYWLFRNTEHGRRILATGHVRVVACGRLRIGNGAILAGGIVPSEIICHEGAELLVGERLDMNYGVSIVARESVRIGNGVLIGSMVRISDSAMMRTAPVAIGDGVWIAHGAVIEPGVTLGDGVVVSAGSVVTTNIPPNTLAMGNPARVLPLSR